VNEDADRLEGDAVKRSQWVRVGVVAAVLAAAAFGAGCSHDARAARPDYPTTGVPANPRLSVILNDGGLQFPAPHIRAGRYLISFQDLRSSRRAGDRVALAFGPSGPRVALVTVPAGGDALGTLIGNDIPWVTVNSVANFSVGGDSLTVDPTRQYPTPAT
jgi:hypothetical protein